MNKSNVSTLTYYSTPGPMTDPREHVALFDDPPTSLPDLVDVMQGMLLHMHWAEAYGVALTEEPKEEANLQPVEQMAACLLAMARSMRYGRRTRPTMAFTPRQNGC